MLQDATGHFFRYTTTPYKRAYYLVGQFDLSKPLKQGRLFLQRTIDIVTPNFMLVLPKHI